MVNDICLVPDWQGLGILLGLIDEDIAMISSYPDQREHCQRVIETWFVRDPELSWEKLQRAIEEVSSRRASYDSAISSIPSTPTSPPGNSIILTSYSAYLCSPRVNTCVAIDSV